MSLFALSQEFCQVSQFEKVWGTQLANSKVLKVRASHGKATASKQQSLKLLEEV